MKKIYEAPTMVSKKITVQSQLLGVSYTDSDDTDISGIDIDSNESGEDQLTKGQGIWDIEW